MPGLSEIALMRQTERRLEEVAAQVKPQVLQAHSPVLNAIPALRVGKRLGIPVVYEVLRSGLSVSKELLALVMLSCFAWG